MDLNSDIIIFDSEVKVGDSLFKDVLFKSIKFSNDLSKKHSQSVNYYFKERGATKPSKDIILGKMGELFASCFMSEHFHYPMLLPDFEIFNGKKKTWKEDLCYSKVGNGLLNLHVKTCDSNTKRFLNGALSWTFQLSNAGSSGFGRDNIYTDGGVVIFVYLEKFNLNYGKVWFSAPWNKIRCILKPPIKRSLHNIKECVYLNDVLELSNRG